MGSDHFIHGFLSLVKQFQSTLPVWGATVLNATSINDLEISIHAPRVGSDRVAMTYREYLDISIHAPRVGSDRSPAAKTADCCYFNPRSPCGERLQLDEIHPVVLQEFQSTLPVWGATNRRIMQWDGTSISIHAPRVGSDLGDAVPVTT